MNRASPIPSAAAMLVRALLIFAALWFAWPVSATTNRQSTQEFIRDLTKMWPGTPFQDWCPVGLANR